MGSLHLDLRVEYSKAKARVTHWQEEILLIAEEMQRTVTFLQWKVTWWRSLAAEHIHVDIQKGMTAYRHRQEAQLLCLAKQFAQSWLPTLQVGSFNVSWVDDFLSSRQQCKHLR